MEVMKIYSNQHLDIDYMELLCIVMQKKKMMHLD